MKNKIWIYPLLIMGLLILTNCKKNDDFTNPDNLSGTEWKSFNVDYSDEEFYLLKFTSKTILELWIKVKTDSDLYKEWTGTYSLNGNKITIDFGDDLLEGVIDGKTMSFSNDGAVVVFTKQ